MPEFDSKNPLGPVKVDRNVLKNITRFEDAAIITAAKCYVEADVHVNPNDITYSLSQREGAFARVNVGLKEGGGYYVLLKKVYDSWVALMVGQDLPGQAMGEKYGLPAGWFSTEY